MFLKRLSISDSASTFLHRGHLAGPYPPKCVMSVLSEWKREWTTEAHVQRQRLTKNSLQRNLRENVSRRVTSSSVSSSVAVVDCCWSRGHCPSEVTPPVPALLAPYLFCALDDGAVCILNTTNFAKTYLFENVSIRHCDKGRAIAKGSAAEHDTRGDRLTAIDCFPLPLREKRELSTTKLASTQPAPADHEVVSVLCTIVDGFVCTCAVNPVTVSQTRSHDMKASSLCRVVKLPTESDLPDKSLWDAVSIRFSPRGSRVAVLASAAGPCASRRTTFSASMGSRDGLQYTTFLCILKRQEEDTKGVYAVEREWASVVPANGKRGAELLRIAWWDDEEQVLLAVWSDGTVCLMDMTLVIVAQTAMFSSVEDSFPGRVTKAALYPPSFHGDSAARGSAIHSSMLSSAVAQGTASHSHLTGLLAVVMDENIVVQFTVRTSTRNGATTECEEPPHKVSKVECRRSGEAPCMELTLLPGFQTHCSEDIPISDIVFFECLLPYALCVLLESGALLVLDATTMEILYQRRLSRHFPSKVTGRKASSRDGDDGKAKLSSNSRGCSFFLRPREKPNAICIMEHNTTVILRAS